MADENLIPSIPNESLVPVVAGAVRSLLGVASGLGFAWAAGVTGDQVTMGVSAAIAVATILWSAWQKIAAARASRRTSLASAIVSAKVSVANGVATPMVVVTPGATPTATN